MVVVEPVLDVEDFGDLVAWAHAHSVRLARDANEHGLDFSELERGVILLRFGDGRAVIGFAGHEHGGRLDFADERNHGALHVLVRILPWRAGEPILAAEDGNVGGERPAIPVDDGIERSGRAEPIGAVNHPAGEDAAAAASGDEEIIGIDVALGDYGVDGGIQIVEIVAGIGVVDQIAEFFAIAGAAAGIDVDDDISGGGPDLFFDVEAIAVIGEWAAVNFEEQRIFFRGVEIGRLDEPAFDFALINGRVEPELLSGAGFFLREQFAIERGDDFL